MQSGGACCTTLALLVRRTTLPIHTTKLIYNRTIRSKAHPQFFWARQKYRFWTWLPGKPKLSCPKDEPTSEKHQTVKKHQILSRRKIKKTRVPPPRLLAEWLKERDGGYTVTIDHRSDRHKLPISDYLSLQNILLEHLQNNNSEESIQLTALPTLERFGYTVDDLQRWSEILKSFPDCAAAYLESEEELPFFLLLAILRYNNISKRHVGALLLHTWYRLLGYSQKEIIPLMSLDHQDVQFAEEWYMPPWRGPPSAAPTFRGFEQNAFEVLISRFLKQARRTLPQAIPTIAHIFGSYLWFTNGTLESRSHGSANLLDNEIHTRLSKLYNRMINKLSLPSNFDPARNMRYAWGGQRALVEQAGRYCPPLLLDQDSYRAIIRVLSGSKKSSTEQKFAAHVAESWPPWREEQHGVDAERPIEDDLSRAVLASRRMVEAGYHLDFLDWEMQITGGRDSDGTPTIASRHVSKRRHGKKHGGQRKWAARIRSTRNVREAWMAFLEFGERKGPIPMSIYHATFEKLVFERLRHIRKQTSEALPGESKEVLQHAFLNFSQDELARTEPMEEGLLYNHMIDSGLVPSGRFLDFLIRTAPNVATGIKYLQDADLAQRALAVMLNFNAFHESDSHILGKISISTLDSFVRLLCRFTYSNPFSEKDHIYSKRRGKFALPNLNGVNQYKTPLLYAIQLVKFYRPLFSPIWYSIFKALAGPRVVIAASFSGHPQDDVLSWQILKTILAEFYSCNLELDLTGFHYICLCFEKAVLSSWNPADEFSLPNLDTLTPLSENWKQDDFEDIKVQWRRMTEINSLPFITTKLLYNFNHAAIHAYTRVLGIARDWEEIVGVLEWMIEHREELDDSAREHGNGKRMRRNVFVAMRFFMEEALEEAEHKVDSGQEGNVEESEREGDTVPPESQEILDEVEERIRSLLDQEGLEEWGGWPEDEEVHQYRERGSVRRIFAECTRRI